MFTSKLVAIVVSLVVASALFVGAFLGTSPQASAMQAGGASNPWSVGPANPNSTIINVGGAGGSVTIVNSSGNGVTVTYTPSTPPGATETTIDLAGNNSTEITIKAGTAVTINAAGDPLKKASGTWSRN